MSFLKTNPVVANGGILASQYASVFENTQLASRLLCVGITSSAAIANTAAETAFNKEYVMAANTIDRVGSILVVRASGVFSNTGTPTLRIKIKLAGVVFVDTEAQTTVSGASSYPWKIEGRLIARQLGSGSQCKIASSHYMRGSGGIASPIYGQFGTTNLITADFTASCAVVFFAQWSAASASNTITMNGFSVSVEIPETTVS